MYIISDPVLTARIRAEIASCFSSAEPESVNIAGLNACPLLQSVVAEVLRLKVAVFINRVSSPADSFPLSSVPSTYLTAPFAPIIFVIH
jgi:hypothetical protein